MLYGLAMETAGAPVRGERRWPMAITLLVAMALPFLLPPNYSLGPRWILPVVEALLLVALVIADPGRIDRRSVFIRALSIGLVVILVGGAAVGPFDWWSISFGAGRRRTHRLSFCRWAH